MAGFNPNQTINTGIYVPTTNVWDQASLNNIDVNSEEFKLLLVRLYQDINVISRTLNIKESAMYDLQEFVNGQMFFSDNNQQPNQLRNNFRRVYNVGAIPPGTTAVNHLLPITNTWTFTWIYGTASDSVGLNFYPIAVAGAGAGLISIRVNATQFIIVNNTGINFTSGIVILEYLKI